MKICTTIEESMKLIELGIDTDTADMCYKCLGEDPYDLIVRPYSDWKEEYKGLLVGKEVDVVPCWSLAALLNTLPFLLIVNNQRYAFSMHKGLNKDGETYVIRYNVFNTDITLCETDYFNNIVDACYEMILKLNELNLL